MISQKRRPKQDSRPNKTGKTNLYCSIIVYTQLVHLKVQWLSRVICNSCWNICETLCCSQLGTRLERCLYQAISEEKIWLWNIFLKYVFFNFFLLNFYLFFLPELVPRPIHSKSCNVHVLSVCCRSSGVPYSSPGSKASRGFNINIVLTHIA